MTTSLGSQGTVCAGGRYDKLVQEFGGERTPAIGFGLGLERLILLLEATGKFPKPKLTDIYVVVLDSSLFNHALVLVERLRDQANDLNLGLEIVLNCSGGSAKSQFKRADKSQAKLAIILGEEEIQQKEVLVKFLREAEKSPVKIKEEELMTWLKDQYCQF